MKGRTDDSAGRMTVPRLRGTGRWLLAVALAAAAVAVAVALTGGVDLRAGPLRFRSRDATRPALIAAVTLLLFVMIDHRWVRRMLASAWSVAESHLTTRLLVAAAMVWTAFAGIAFNTWAAGGSDSYGYVSQVQLFKKGALVDHVDFDPAFPWRDAARTLVPLGYVPTDAADVIAPTYPPGLSLLMLLAAPVGERGVYLVVPVIALVLIGAVARAGSRLGDPLAGAAAAVLLSASPTFLYQLVQPMSDIPAAAFWLLAALLVAPDLRASSLAGACAAIAILIRPNLAPLVGVLAALGWGSRAWTRKEFVAFLLPVVAGVGMLMVVQHVRYGSATASGYGRMSDLFSLASVWVNVRQYPRWITAAFTPLIWLSLLAPLGLRRVASPRLGWGLIGLATAVWLLYLPYVAFQPHEWHYTRFLLLALAIMLLLAMLVILRFVRFVHLEVRAILFFVVLVGWLFALSNYAIKEGAFQLREAERKYPVAGAAVVSRAGPNAWVFALQHSGSLRLYARSRTIRWDLMHPADIDRAIEVVQARYGHAPIAVLDPGEVDLFRERFAGSKAVASMTLLDLAGDTRIYGFAVVPKSLSP